MTEYLKRAEWHAPAASARGAQHGLGDAAADRARRRARDPARTRAALDGWVAPSFLVEGAAIDRGRGRARRPSCAEHIAFAQEQVRGFALAQRATLADLELETLPGVTLGHRHIPVGAVGAYVPGGRYPMLASAFMTVIVPKVGRRRQVVAGAPPQRGRRDPSGDAPRDGDAPAPTRSSASAACRRSPRWRSGSAASSRPTCSSAPGTRTWPRRSASSSAGWASTSSPGRPRSRSSPTRAPTPAWSRPTSSGQAEHGPTSPSVLITTSRRLGARRAGGGGRAARHVADARGRRPGMARSRDRRGRRGRRRGRARSPTRRAGAPRGPRRRREAGRLSGPAAQLRLAVPRRRTRRSRTATRRWARTTCCRRWGRRGSPAACGSASS